MINGKKLVAVLPAYNAARTLRKTYDEIDMSIVDEIILVDDASTDETAKVASELGINTVVHVNNKGYGGNQKTCYRLALEMDADIVVMLHPDYQYTPKLICGLASLIAVDLYDVVLGSRILVKGALKGGMPLYKFVANRLLTCVENLMVRKKLSDFHTGYRAFSRRVLETLPLDANSDDFVFDNQMLVQSIYFGFRIGEISCPAKYFGDASTIDFKRGAVYGMGVLRTGLEFMLQRTRLFSFDIFDNVAGRLHGRELRREVPQPEPAMAAVEEPV